MTPADESSLTSSRFSFKNALRTLKPNSAKYNTQMIDRLFVLLISSAFGKRNSSLIFFITKISLVAPEK